MGFDVDDFVSRCSAAVRESDAPQRIASILSEVVADPGAIAQAMLARQEGKSPPPMADVFVNNDDLTIYQVTFPANLYGVPHDHAGWAVVGVYKGAEEFNVYEEEDGRLIHRDHQVMQAPSVQILPSNLIHDIENSTDEPSGSIHVYSNRHFDLPGRRIWRGEAAQPEPFTVDRSFIYGVERTNRIRRDRGLGDVAMPTRTGLLSNEPQ